MGRSTVRIDAWLQKRSAPPKQPLDQDTVLELDHQVEVEISLPDSSPRTAAVIHKDNVHLGLGSTQACLRLSQYPHLDSGGAHIVFDIPIDKDGAVVLVATNEHAAMILKLKLVNVVEPYTVAATNEDLDISLSSATARAWCTIPYQILPVNTVLTITAHRTETNEAKIDQIFAALAHLAGIHGKNSPAGYSNRNRTSASDRRIITSHDESSTADKNELGNAHILTEVFVDKANLRDASDSSEQSSLGLHRSAGVSTMSTIADEVLTAERSRNTTVTDLSIKAEEPWCDFTTVGQRAVDRYADDGHRDREWSGRSNSRGRRCRNVSRSGHRGRGDSGGRQYKPAQNYHAMNRGRTNVDSRRGRRGRGGRRARAATRTPAARLGQNGTASEGEQSVDRWSREVTQCWKPAVEAVGESQASGVLIGGTVNGSAKCTPPDSATVLKTVGMYMNSAKDGKEGKEGESLI